jgi:hypothetical protein
MSKLVSFFIVLALVLALAVFVGVSYLYYYNQNVTVDKDNAAKSSQSTNMPQDNNQPPKISPGNNVTVHNQVNKTGGGSGGSGASSGSVSSGPSNNENPLPADLTSVECGFYYSRYGVCAGTCLQGSCTSEGRSCYCKIN